MRERSSLRSRRIGATHSPSRAPHTQSTQHVRGRQAVEFDRLVLGGMATDQLDFAARTLQPSGQELDQGFIRRRIDRRRRYVDSQLISQHVADAVAGSPWLQLDFQNDAIRLFAEEWRKRHWVDEVLPPYRLEVV
jgi:hypothetical protein